jgi:CspA family cold shock protein
MGKHRDRREQRRRSDDGFPSIGDTSSEPVFFQRPEAQSSQQVDAEVVWFNAAKGFGFVKTSDGIEAYMHIRALEAAEQSTATAGTRLKIVLEKGHKGYHVSQVLAVMGTAAAPFSHQTAPTGLAPAQQVDDQGEGTVKWYNSDKGFGFIRIEGSEKDIFVHATALSRAGLTELAEGQKVAVAYSQGMKGLEARSIRLI